MRDDLKQTCELLAHFPGIGRDRSEFAPGLRSHALSSPVVVYYVATDTGIEVQRVFHARQHVDASMFSV